MSQAKALGVSFLVVVEIVVEDSGIGIMQKD
jgi:hypothetical protein